MPSSLDLPKKTRTAPRKKSTGRPDNITKVLAEYRFERMWRDPQNLERELRSVQGTMLIYRTAETPDKAEKAGLEPGSKEGAGHPSPVEFMIIDNEGKRIETDVADTFGHAEDYGHVFARQRGLELINSTIPFRPDSLA